MSNINRFVEFSRVIEIGEDQTAVVRSFKSGESMVLANNPEKPYGADFYVWPTIDEKEIAKKCEQVGFPKHLIFKDLQFGDGKVYLSTLSGRIVYPNVMCVEEETKYKNCHLRLKKARAYGLKLGNETESRLKAGVDGREM